MAYQKVELRIVRDFSEVLNDTFLFIRQNLKPLLISFGAISGLFMLASAVLNGLYQGEIVNLMDKVVSGKVDTDEIVSPSYLSPSYFLVPLLAWLNFIAMKTSVIAYVKVYQNKNIEPPELLEVWDVFKHNFFRVFIYSLPIIFVIAIGTIFCIAPGLYLWVVLLPFEMVLVLEERTFSKSWDRCFALIKDHWWLSFAIYAVSYIIYIAGTWIIGSVMELVSNIFTYFTTADFSTEINLVKSILTVFSFVFFVIFYIAAILNYYSLAEQLDGTGILERLEKLGTKDPADLKEEEY